MKSSVLKGNMELSEALKTSQLQVADLKQQLELSLQFIKDFGHFVPNTVETFFIELTKLKQGAVNKDSE